MRTYGGTRWRHFGLTLIELLVALAIGVVLSFGVVNLFLHSKLSYLQDEEMARLQENGRYALRYLSREMNMAGHLANVLWGERVGASPDGTDCFDYLMDTRRPFEHLNDITPDGIGTGHLPKLPADCLREGEYMEGSDMLLVRRTLDSPSVIQGAEIVARDPNSTYLRVQDHTARVTLEQGGGGLHPGVDIWEYFPQIIFLRSYSRNTSDGIPTLCRLRLASGSNRVAPLECLVEGVEHLQVEFGIDEDGDQRPDRYTQAPPPDELEMAVAARIFVLVRSLHPVSGYRNRQAYTLGSKQIPAANDGHYRRVVQTTVLLRNAAAFKS